MLVLTVSVHRRERVQVCMEIEILSLVKLYDKTFIFYQMLFVNLFPFVKTNVIDCFF